MSAIDGLAEKENEMTFLGGRSKDNKNAPMLVGTKHKKHGGQTTDVMVTQCRQFTNYLRLVLVEAGKKQMETEEAESGREGGRGGGYFFSSYLIHTNSTDSHSHSGCQLIYFHLPSQVRKFGLVTKSTKRTCP